MPSRIKNNKSDSKKTKAVQSSSFKRSAIAAFTDDIEDEELALTVETLTDVSRILASDANDETSNHNLNKRLKPLRSAVHEFIRASSISKGGSLTNRISEALSDARWMDARVMLAEFHIRKEVLKLGTLQRWVRDVDAATASNLQQSESEEVFRTLHGILLATGTQKVSSDLPVEADQPYARQAERSMENNDLRVLRFTEPLSFSEVSGLDLREEVLTETIYSMVDPTKTKSQWASNLKLIHITPANERKPPNQYDATIYTSTVSSLGQSSNVVKRYDIPQVPGAFVLESVLDADECRSIVSLGESIGFSPDCAIAGSATQQASILAHNFYYLADPQTLAAIFNRVAALLPQQIEGCALKGLNARFRVYRYVPGAVYRPHIDGSWPRSGLDLAKPDGQQYLYDDTREGAQLSRLTFLIYLNDEFSEGFTTFFMPTAEALKGIRVVPRMGSVLVFPHGETTGALLHEGSAVSRGAKYVIRTDVLYERDSVKK